MITRIKSDRIVTPEGLFSGYVYFDQEQILQVTAEERPFDQEYDYRGKIVSPGFVDMHVHGGNNYDFASADAEDLPKIANFHLSHGTTTIVPTVTSVAYDTICKSLDNLRAALASGEIKSHVAGIHLEGPYFSPLMSGAQNPEHLTNPIPEVYQSLVEKYGDLIKRWSYAPELDQDLQFVQYLTDHGIVPSAGHTAAIYDDCVAAFEKGCRLITHLFSCTSTITRVGGFRRLGVIETAFLLDDMDVEIIADGKHLPPELIRLICKIKGYDRVSLVTDAMQAAGSTAKESSIGGMACIIEDGVAKLPDRSAFAGSIATTDRLLRVCVKDVGIPIPQAVQMLTANPARIMGINAGKIQPGLQPDFVVFDDDICVSDVFVSGAIV